MSQKERLRKALEWLPVSRPLVPFDWWCHQQDREAWKDAVPKAQAALDATSGPTDMDKLEKEIQSWSDFGGKDKRWQGGYSHALLDVLDHIRTVKEGDDATEREGD